MDEEALDFLQMYQTEMHRSALNAIELGVLTTERSADGHHPYHAGCGIRMYPEAGDHV